jgi:hypothetical protein
LVLLSEAISILSGIAAIKLQLSFLENFSMYKLQYSIIGIFTLIPVIAFAQPHHDYTQLAKLGGSAELKNSSNPTPIVSEDESIDQ